MDRPEHLVGDDREKPAAGKSAIVVGGGLAGVSAALELAERGYGVTLLEKRPYLGGRAFSFIDKETGAEVDNGQHVFMKCCTAYIALLRKLGVEGKTRIQRRLRVNVTDGKGVASPIYRTGLPAPLHLGPSLLRYKHIGLADKLRVGRTVLAMKRMSLAKRRALDGVSFYDWLRSQGQSERSIGTLWNLIVLPTCNDDAKNVSASQAIMVFQEGLLRDATGADIGYSRVPLSKLLSQEAAQAIAAKGGWVLLDRTAQRFTGDAKGIAGLEVFGHGAIRADAYITALPPKAMLELLPDSLRNDAFFTRAEKITMSPIVNLHFWFDRKVADWEFASFLDNAAHWVFNKSAMSDSGSGPGQYLSVSLSGAHAYIDMPKEELRARFLAELGKAIPAITQAQVTRFIVVRERFATFSPSPGSAANRLPCRTPVPNLFLAGEWTDNDWPSTMEGAVRSGAIAADEVAKAV
jgi:squalene-associated FAD-dependent desaturase